MSFPSLKDQQPPLVPSRLSSQLRRLTLPSHQSGSIVVCVERFGGMFIPF